MIELLKNVLLVLIILCGILLALFVMLMFFVAIAELWKDRESWK